MDREHVRSASFPARKRREEFLGSRVALTAAREHLIRNWRTRRAGGEGRGGEKSSFHPCERSSCIRIQSRSFRYVRSQTFSPFLLPTDLPPSIPPVPPAPAADPPPLSGPRLSLSSSLRSMESCNGATTRSRPRTRARNDPRVHRAPFATDRRCDVAWARRDEIAKRVVAKLRYYAISRFPAEARDLPLLFSGGERTFVCVRVSRIVETTCLSHIYLAFLSFLFFHFSFVLRDKIQSSLFRRNAGGRKKYCCS